MDINLPQDLESERRIIGRMLNYQSAAEIAAELLVVEDFSSEKHGIYFTVLKQILFANLPLTCEILLMKLKDLKLSADVLSSSYIIEIAHSYCGTSEDMQYFCEKIKQISKYRRIIVQNIETARQASSQEKTPEQIQTDLMDGLDRIFDDNETKTTFTFNDLISNKYWDGKQNTLFEHIQNKQELFRKGKLTLTGISTGFKNLDAALDGINNGHLIVVGARSGVGKTTFILHLIRNMIRNGIKVYMQSLEMDKMQITEKLLCVTAGVSFTKMKTGNLTHSEYGELLQAGQVLKNDSFLVDESSTCSVHQFGAKVRRLIKSDGIQVVFLDYLTLINAEKKYNSREEQVQYISKSVTALAKTLNIPIICICQLNRQNETDKRAPRKSDLRESGQIEQDAHSIIMIHRPSEFDNLVSKDLTELHIVKNRFFPQTRLNFYFNPHTESYIEMTKVEDDIKNANNQ